MIKLIESTHALDDVDEIQGDLGWCENYAYDLTNDIKFLEKYLLNGNRKSKELDDFLISHALEIDEATTRLHDIRDLFKDLAVDLQNLIYGIK